MLATPDVALFQREEGHQALVLGSDGLWDGLSPDEVLSIVSEELKGKSAATAARRLVEAARKNQDDLSHKSHRDDTTALVVALRPWE